MQKNIYFFNLNSTGFASLAMILMYSNYMGTRNSMKGAGKTLSMNYM